MCDEVVVHLRRPIKLYIRGIYVDIDIIKMVYHKEYHMGYTLEHYITDTYNEHNNGYP